MACFINGTPVSVFHNTFATKSFVAAHVADSLGLAVHEGVCSATVTVITGDDQLSAPFALSVVEHAQYDVLLGRDWVAISNCDGKYNLVSFCCDVPNV